MIIVSLVFLENATLDKREKHTNSVRLNYDNVVNDHLRNDINDSTDHFFILWDNTEVLHQKRAFSEMVLIKNELDNSLNKSTDLSHLNDSYNSTLDFFR